MFYNDCIQDFMADVCCTSEQQNYAKPIISITKDNNNKLYNGCTISLPDIIRQVTF